MSKHYIDFTKDELESEIIKLREEYDKYKSMNLKLDMSRGKPGTEQINITQGMLGVISEPADCVTENGFDCRNYGLLDGIPEAKRIFAEMLNVPEKNILVGGNSSLNLMFDTIARMKLFTWKNDNIKFLCPVPGYDRHFAICEALGIEMINVPMLSDGPDMDIVDELVKDDSVKGIWCVPKYSNPDGITYSDEVVRRFANLKPAAADFRIFWDNAYVVHDLYDIGDSLLNLFDEAVKANNEDIVFMFASTSKISFPGSGVAVMAASDNNIKEIKRIMAFQTIGFDKINQMRHVKYFKNLDGIITHMKKHAEFLRPKFKIVLDTLENELAPYGVGHWVAPNGGYFISLNVPDGCAKRTFGLVKEAGVVLTSAGATFPYGVDPDDRNLRIAPTYPSNEELIQASAILCLCVKIASIEKFLNNINL